MTNKNTEVVHEKKSLKDLVNSPFKKAMFAVQIVSYVLIPGSPLIGGLIGRALKLSAAYTGGLILTVFIVGEVLFYGSLFFLGKEVVMIVWDSLKRKFKKKA